MSDALTTERKSRLKELEQIVKDTEKVLSKAFVQFGAALMEIRDHKLWTEEAGTWDQYCKNTFDWSRERASQLIRASKVVLALPPKAATMVAGERQARALADVPEEKRAEVLEEVAGSGEITARRITKAAEQIEQPPTEQVDAMGFPVPKSCQKYLDVDEVRAIRGELRKIKALTVSAAATSPKLFVEVNIQSVETHLSQAYKELEGAIPHAVCPQCEGVKPKCDLCKGRGLISKFRWNVTVPEEMKAARQKKIQEFGK